MSSKVISLLPKRPKLGALFGPVVDMAKARPHGRMARAFAAGHFDAFALAALQGGSPVELKVGTSTHQIKTSDVSCSGRDHCIGSCGTLPHSGGE